MIIYMYTDMPCSPSHDICPLCSSPRFRRAQGLPMQPTTLRWFWHLSGVCSIQWSGWFHGGSSDRTTIRPLTVPSGNLTQLWKIPIFNGKIHYKWPFSIAMLVHQRVDQISEQCHWGRIWMTSSVALPPALKVNPPMSSWWTQCLNVKRC